MRQLLHSATELRDALRNGNVSAREVTEHALRELESHRALGAFVSISAEHALETATAADATLGRTCDRDTLSQLHGIPIAHKDLSDVQGSVTTHGTAALTHTIAHTDSAGVAVLRAAGTVSLGKTQVPEFGLNAYSENLIAPPARNPLNAALTPGGSSGGSAAAVAAGILPFAPGSDGGGSIRIPALACGLIGLKPGLGAIAADISDGTLDRFGAPRFVVTGPLAHTPIDAALLYDAMRGDPAESSVRAVTRAAELRPLRIAVSTASPFTSAHPTPCSPDSLAALDAAVTALTGLGHHLEPAAFRYDPGYADAFRTAWMAHLSLLDLTPDAEAQLTPFTRSFRTRALEHTDEAHAAAGTRLREFAAEVRKQWGAYDAVLTPGLAFAPPEIGSFTALTPDADYQRQCEWTPFTSMVNVSGLPAIAAPTLRLESGLSMGVQLIGRARSEAQLLQLAQHLFELTATHHQA